MHLKTLVFAFASALIALLAVPSQSVAQHVLTITGVGEAPIELNLADLEAMEVESFTTTTIWTEGEVTFTGVPLSGLLEELGVEDGVLLATAINDYTIEFPVADALEVGPILAYLMNGEPMSVRDKGPLWIVFPYDSNPDFQSEVVYSRSIWQLNQIEVSN